MEGNAYVRPLYVDAPEELADKYAEIEEEVAFRLRKYPKSPEGFVLILNKRGYGLMSAVPASVINEVKKLPKNQRGKVYGLIIAISVNKSKVITEKQEEEELIEEVEENPQARMTLKDKVALEKFHRFLVILGSTFQITGLPTSVEHKPIKIKAKPKPLPTEKQSEKAFEEIKKETEEEVVKDAVKELQTEGKTTITLMSKSGKFFDVKITAKEISENNMCGMSDESIARLFDTVSKAKTGTGLNTESKEMVVEVIKLYCKTTKPTTTAKPTKPAKTSKSAPMPTPIQTQRPKPSLRIKTPPPTPQHHFAVTPYMTKYTPRVTPHQFTRAVHEHLRKLIGGKSL